MIDIQYNKSIRSFTTFGVPVIAKKFTKFSNLQELKEVILHPELKNEEILILGGGSNLLFTKDFNGVVVLNTIQGIEIVEETDEKVLVKSGAGENWHEFVLYCVRNNFAGVENLSLIPGSVGASPMQNIGAYGVEIKDVFHSLEAFHIESGEIKTFTNEECNFGYRESIFKNKVKNQFVITSVTFALSKKPEFKTSYGAINTELELMGIKELSIKAISQAVINIRTSKLPDPKEIGNAGSFFKNPVISREHFEQLIAQFPEIANYPLPDGSVKIAAGWLIDFLGWKGKRIGDYGVHKNQALVLVNYKEAQGSDIFNLSSQILASVEKTFGIKLEREVNIF